jgi:hypothetical protein
MDKLFDTILKNVPAEIVPALLACVVAFFGVHYAKGLRSYTDTLSDKTFITFFVAICALFIVYYIHKSDRTELAEGARPLLLVPDFEGDEQRAYKSHFIQQLQAFVGKLNKDATIVPLKAHIRDRQSARLTGKSYSATAVLYEPKVLRLEDKKTVICFNLLVLDPAINKPYPPLPAEIEKATLEDISGTLLGSLASGQAQKDPIVARIDAIERKVNELTAAIFKTTALVQPAPTDRKYHAKRAILVGVDYQKEREIPPLQYAVSDAQKMEKALNLLGFESTVIPTESATRARILTEIDKAVASSKPDDMLLVYYAGFSMSSTSLQGELPKMLVLNTYDFKLSKPIESLTLDGVIERLRSATTVFRLLIIDGCHGTFGLSPSALGAAARKERPFQIIAGTGDDELAIESDQFRGGIFTHALTKTLENIAEGNRRISTNELLAATTTEVYPLSSGGQRPKLVTLAGSEDVVFMK